MARTATANIVNIVCPKEEGIILTKLQQRTNQEARFVIFIPGVFEAEGTRARLGLASGLCPGRLRGAAGIYKKPLSSKMLTRLVATAKMIQLVSSETIFLGHENYSGS